MAKKKKKNKPNKALKTKTRAATRLSCIFSKSNSQQFVERAGTPFRRLENIASNLLDVCDEQTKKQYNLYSARKVTDGLRSMYRNVQRIGAEARTQLDKLIDDMVDAHSRLLKKNEVKTGRSIPVPSMRDLMSDLDAIERDFVEWRHDEHMLAVTTKPVILKTGDGESVDLGPFEIRLKFPTTRDHWFRYELHALHPNPCDGLVHPHINTGGELCEGAAEGPIHNALANGLVYEFFQVVNNTITNYNPDSPYIALEEWTGEAGNHCTDCGVSDHDEELYPCENCSELFCGHCSSWCDVSGITICNVCLDDYRRGNDGCCNAVGKAGCLIRENDECASCGEVVADDEHYTCIVGRSLCLDCVLSMIENDEPCCREDVTVAEAKAMGTHDDGVCKYGCMNANADSTKRRLVAQCPLREHGYQYVSETVEEAVD